MKKNHLSTAISAKPPHPDIEKFRDKIFKNYKRLIIVSFFLACILPADIREASHAFDNFISLIELAIPYIAWIEANSKVPGLSSTWFSIVWILIFIYLLNLLFIFPYSHASEMLQAASPSTWKKLQVGLIFLLLSWMTYSIFFERNFAIQKSLSSGHARFIETLAMDSRLGLIFLGPLIMSVCIFIWGGALLYAISNVTTLISSMKNKGA